MSVGVVRRVMVLGQGFHLAFFAHRRPLSLPGDCLLRRLFLCGGCRLHHKDDVNGTRPVRSADLLHEASLELTRLHCLNDRGCALSRLDKVGLRQLVRADCADRRAIWCGRHSIVLRQGVESFHMDVVVVRVSQPSTASVSSMGSLRSFTLYASICKTLSLSKLCTSSRK